MGNIKDIYDYHIGITLGGKAKKFKWSYDGEKIMVNKDIGKLHNNIQSEFTNNEISLILSYIKNKEKASLSNSVSRLKDGTEKDGIGKFIYEIIKSDITLAQDSSQLVSILVSAKVLDYNGKKRNMEFWLINEEWKDALIKYFSCISMRNLDEYTVCKANSKEWARYHAIYRLSSFNEWMPMSFQGEIDRYNKVDFCYWVVKDNKRIDGALIKPNKLKCVFVIPPFCNKRILLEKLNLYVDSISVKNEEIEVSDGDLKSIQDYESLGYKIELINKLMVCPTNKFDIAWGEEYKVISPEIEHSEAMSQLYHEAYSKSKFPYNASQSYDFQVSSVKVYFDHIKSKNVPNNWSTLIYHVPTKKFIAACTVGLVNELPYILDFVVHPEYQGKGLESKMMKRTLSITADDYPAIRLNVTVGNDAEIFYKKMGFISLAENIEMKREVYV